MASRDSLEVRQLLQRGAVQVSRDDTPVAIRLFYVGSGSVTSVTVDTATDLEMITSDGGTDTYAFATYTTVGALADKINDDGIFQAVVLDALRSDATTASNFVTGAITVGSDVNGVAVWDVLVDTSVNLNITSTLSLNRNFNSITEGHRVILQAIAYNVNVSAAEANAVRVYFRNGGAETQQIGRASVDATLTEIDFANGVGSLTAPEGADIIVRVQDATSVTNAAGNFVEADGIYQ